MYKMDRKFVSVKNIPANIVELLNTNKEVDDTDLPPAPMYRGCIFCDKHSKLQRTVNLQTVYLCDEHYYDKTIGQVAQQLNEKKRMKVKIA